jgi:hypothetical protein
MDMVFLIFGRLTRHRKPIEVEKYELSKDKLITNCK